MNLYQLSRQVIASRAWVPGDVAAIWHSKTGRQRALLIAQGKWLYLVLCLGDYRLPDLLTVGEIGPGGVACPWALTDDGIYRVWAERVRVQLAVLDKPRYRVCYRDKVGEPFERLYFKTLQTAREEFKELRRQGCTGMVQHWNRRDGIWVG